jgi:hypothetical protein
MTQPSKATRKNKADDKLHRQTTQGLVPVSRAARPVIVKTLPKQSAYFQQLFELWVEITAGSIAAGTVPEKLTLPKGQQKDGVLSIWTVTSAQAAELSFEKSNLIQKINKLFGFSLVSDLRLVAFPKMLAESPVKVNVRPQKPSQSLDKTLSDISNPSLRSALNDLGQYLTTANDKTGPHNTHSVSTEEK